jgi:hypothetical protein
MAKQYLVVTEDQILVDLDLVFAAIRQADGDWEQVHEDLMGMMETVNHMVEQAEEASTDN